MSTIAQVSETMQMVLVQAAEAADALVGFTQRADKAVFTASTLTQTFALGFLAHPTATRDHLHQTAARLGVDVSPQAIDQRFNARTAALLLAVLTTALQHAVRSDQTPPLALLQRFTGVLIQDSTNIALPDELQEVWQGAGGSGPVAVLKLGTQIDWRSGALTALDLVDGRTPDTRLPCQQQAIPAGSLRLADLGFFDLTVLQAIAAAQAYFLSKLLPRTCIIDANGKSWTLCEFVRRLGDVPRWEGWVTIGRDTQVAARLLVERVPPEVADQRRRRIRQDARRKGRTPSAAALALAAWTILITNVPADQLSHDEALVLARVRWQIELLFKLWKSHGQIDQWRSADPVRILCELYAKLLAMVLQHWLLVVSCWHYPDRSLVKVAKAVRDYATDLASARGCPHAIARVVTALANTVRRTGRMNPRAKHPNTYQLVAAVTVDEPLTTELDQVALADLVRGETHQPRAAAMAS